MKDEQLWWEKFRAGDEQSFKLIFERYNTVLFNYGYRFTKDEALIDDSVQELFVKLWYNQVNIGCTPSVKNYLLKSFRRILVRKIDYGVRFLSLKQFDDEHLPFHIALPHEVDFIRKERLAEIREQLATALAKMSPRQQEIIHLRYYEELSYEQVADIMSLSIKDTYKLFYRAMDSLRKYVSRNNLLALLLILSHEQA